MYEDDYSTDDTTGDTFTDDDAGDLWLPWDDWVDDDYFEDTYVDERDDVFDDYDGPDSATDYIADNDYHDDF